MIRKPDRGRRRLVRGGALVAGAAAIGPVPMLAAAQPAQPWHREADVIVVGSGAAGFAAALFARNAGADVLMLEKGPAPGGTTIRSGGVHFIPNNHLLRAAGLSESRDDFLRLMVRVTYPERYHPDLPNFGADTADFALLDAFYQAAAPTIEQLEQIAGFRYMLLREQDGEFFPDNFVELPENRCPRGRSIVCVPESVEPGRYYYPGGGGLGVDLVALLRGAANRQRVPILTRHEVVRLVANAHGAVIGVVAGTRDGERWFRARRGVVFGSGGYLHNAALRQAYLPARVYGGCGSPINQGTLLNLAGGAGAALGNLDNAWWKEVLLEEAVLSSDTPTGIWVAPGDSTLMVDRYGNRFCNEKNQPGGRPQHHFEWDPVRVEYPRLVTFLIWDERAVELFGGIYGIQQKQGDLPAHVISGKDLASLADNIAARLARFAEHTGGFTLDEEFAEQLPRTVARYNAFAREGKDADFHRGDAAADRAWHFYGGVPVVPNPHPNPLMHPLCEQGPYYAALIVAGAIDTKGGPRINPNAQVLKQDGSVIAGLYGAGNCIAHLSAGTYWGGGGTIGPAVVFGALAGAHAAGSAPNADG
ncbi:MAG: FAD-dependent oxidoreductase [Pseudomonadota bacterium]|nr:FAD-dependent oxidoreductase [Pseudomonadota bacterium]